MRYLRRHTFKAGPLTAALFSLLLSSSPAMAQAPTVTAMWDASPATDQVTSYQVCIGTSSLSCNVALASVDESQTGHTITPASGTRHYVAIRAINANGVGPYSSEVNFSIPGLGQPSNQSSPVGTAITPLDLTATDPDGSSLTFTHTGLPPGLTMNSATGRITGTPSAAGSYNVTVFVADNLASVSRSFVWTVTSGTTDTAAPTLAITSHSSGQTVTSASVTIGGTATDSGRGGNGISQVTVNGAAATNGTASGSNTATWSRAITLASGANTITVEAVDGAGNLRMEQITLNASLPVAPVTGATILANLISPQNAGTAVTFTASGSGGVGPRQYKFLLQSSGGAVQTVQNWSTATTYTWTPSTAANYTVSVWARSAGVTADVAQASAQMPYTINTPPPAPVTSATLSANVASPQATGTPITFSAGASGGVGPRQYKFLLQSSGGAVQTVQNWSTATTYTWTPSTAANYTVSVWARSAGVTADVAQASAQMAYTVNTPPVTPVASATIQANLASPQNTNTPITFTATASGGVAPRQFKFLVAQNGGVAQTVQNWSTSTTYTWTPATAAAYTVSVWVRSAGVTTDAAQASAQIAYTVDMPPVPLAISSLTSNVASPQADGTTVRFTAAATGGRAPYQFKWWVYDGTVWTPLQNWSTAATFDWRPTTAGAYLVAAWARNSGDTTDASQAMAQVAFTITDGAPRLPLTISSLTSNVASPQAAGTTVTFTATAAGGQAPYQFKWWVYDGTSWRVAQSWSTSATFNWRPTTAGTYLVAVWGRNSGVTADASQAMAQVAYTITNGTPNPPLTISLASNVASPQASGTTVTFTAAATGGRAPYQFKWWVYDGKAWRLLQDWSTSATFNWRPTTADTYLVAVWGRSSGVTVDASQAMAQVAYTITNGTPIPPLTISSLASSVASPQASGTTVTFTAAASGGRAPYQFKWWVYDGEAWRLAQGWSTSNTFNWRPATAGTYLVAVWGRNHGTTADASEALAQVAYTITDGTPVPPLAITSFTSSMSSPQLAGTTVTFTATASGGEAPYQFKWWVFDGTEWRVAQNWNSSPTLDWRPNKPGSYIVAVWGRNTGVKVDASQALAQSAFVILEN
jgi:hypothetical protein